MERVGGTITAGGLAVPEAIIKGRERAAHLVGGLQGDRLGERGRGTDAIAERAPGEQGLTPEGWRERREV